MIPNLTFHPESVSFLLLVLLVPLGIWRTIRRHRRASLAYSSIRLFDGVGPGFFVRLRWLPTALRVAVLILLVCCLARPIEANQQARVFVDGIAIEMVIDRSSSMSALDFKIDGKQANRLEVVKQVARHFVAGEGQLKGRPDDMVGLISFAGFADSISPPTLDHGYLLDGVKQMRIADRGSEEDGTAIGDALALAVEHLRDLGEHADPSGYQRIRSKVIILLTDGQNTAGDLDPLKAAQLAATEKIRVYTIGAGTQGYAPMPIQIGKRTILQDMPVTIDEDTLTKIAEITGGRYFRATETDSLTRIYQQIDELEKTRTQERRYLSFKDLATSSIDAVGVHWPPILLTSLILLSLELALSFTRFQTIP